jgi:WD40 repeat protein
VIGLFGGAAPDLARQAPPPPKVGADQRAAQPKPSTKPDDVPAPPSVVTAGEPQLVKTFHGHTGKITAVAFAPDGASFASASFDKSVRLWKPDEDEPIAKLPHKDSVHGVAYAPDSKTLATCTDQEGAVRLWDVATRKETMLGVQGGPWGYLRCVAFRSDGQLLASGSMAVVSQESVKLWNIAEKKAWSSLGVARDRSFAGVHALAFCPGTRLLAVANHVAPHPCGVRLWDTATREELDFLAGPSIALAFSPDGRKLAAAEGRDVTLWSFNPEKKSAVKGSDLQAATGFGFPKLACSAAFAPDNRTLAVAYNDGTVILWNTQTSEQLASFTAHAVPRSSTIHYQECSVAFAPNGQHLLTGGFDHLVKLWKLTTVSGNVSK